MYFSLVWSGLGDAKIGYCRVKLSYTREELGASSQIMRKRREENEDMSGGESVLKSNS